MRRRFSLPAFDASNLETVRAVLAAAEAGAPVVLQRERDAIADAAHAP